MISKEKVIVLLVSLMTSIHAPFLSADTHGVEECEATDEICLVKADISKLSKNMEEIDKRVAAIQANATGSEDGFWIKALALVVGFLGFALLVNFLLSKTSDRSEGAREIEELSLKLLKDKIATKPEGPQFGKIDPPSGLISGGERRVLYGSGFDDSSQIIVGGEPASIVKVEPASIEFTTPPLDLDHSHLVDVSVKTKAGEALGKYFVVLEELSVEDVDEIVANGGWREVKGSGFTRSLVFYDGKTSLRSAFLTSKEAVVQFNKKAGANNQRTIKVKRGNEEKSFKAIYA